MTDEQEVVASEAAAEAPKNKGGWPKGRPRKPIREEVREPIKAEVRKTRKRRGNVDPLWIDPRDIPAGTTYEWKRQTVYGMRNPGYEVALAENGWEPVPVSRHRGFMPPGWKGSIERDGLILMERPAYLTEEARQEDQMMARENLRAQMGQNSQAPQGTLSRDHPAVQPRARTTIEPIDIPTD